MREEWCVKSHADVIHLNCGLHDIVRLYGPHKSRIPLAAYRENVRTILDTLVEFTSAKIIWATTTPVNEETYLAHRGLVCSEDDIAGYNEVSVALASEVGVPVNDLHAAVMAAGRDSMLGDDGIHYTEAGYRLLGQEVADAIRNAWPNVPTCSVLGKKRSWPSLGLTDKFTHAPYRLTSARRSTSLSLMKYVRR